METYEAVEKFQDDTREKACLKSAEQESHHIKLKWRGYEHHGCRSETPEHHDAQQRLARADFLQEEIARYFKQEISDEKNTCAQAVDSVVERQGLLHLQLRITDIDAVEISDHVGDQQQGNEVPIYLRKHRVESGAFWQRGSYWRLVCSSRIHVRSPVNSWAATVSALLAVQRRAVCSSWKACRFSVPAPRVDP